MKKPTPIEAPELKLAYSSVEEHCEALLRIKKARFWWYMGMTAIPWNFSLPFRDGAGRWWYQVKPGFCWPVDFLRPVKEDRNTIPFLKKYLGYQQIVPEPDSNSRLIINVIEDISSFTSDDVPDKRCNIRVGLGSCTLDVLEKPDERAFSECAEVWRDFVGRTAWKRVVGKKYIRDTWSMLFDIPGASIILGRDKESGRVAGFLITKIIGDTAYFDTIASSTELMKTKVNDALVFSFVMNAKRLTGVEKAHYAIVSYKASLEKFKHSHGFRPVSYPARIFLNPPLGAVIRLLRADSYNRMTGNMEIAA